MLVFSRKKNESLVLNNDITITVVEIRGDKVRLGVVCPKEYAVHREEVFNAIHGWRRPKPRPSSPEEKGFLQAIVDSPGDEGLRLVFADWLEERGDPLAEFIRLRCALANLPAGDERRKSSEARERALWREHGIDWEAALPGELWTVAPCAGSPGASTSP
jgi:carbon storage regulator